MTTEAVEPSGWENFVIAYGWAAQLHELAAVIGQPVDDISRLRRNGVCSRQAQAKRFDELFTLWHGRPPTEDEWPAPRKLTARDTYEWQPPEDALLASLVGVISQDEIVEVLTARLREKTGDPAAERTPQSVQVHTNRIGLQTTDVVGGLTTSAAAREINSIAIVQQAIAKGELPTRRVGRLHVIPHAVWAPWKAARSFPPAGYVRLTSIREPLGIKSDKLSEYARMGLIRTAVRCTPYGTKGPSTQFGTWWISQEAADQIVADRQAGRPMPWQGKYLDNLRGTFKLWVERKHPDECEICERLWGEQGAPATFEDFSARYPGLAHGAKRHLTRPWTPGVTLEEVAKQAGRSLDDVRLAIDNGALQAVTRKDGLQYVTQTDATRWIARHCPSGEGRGSWLSLEVAAEKYGYCVLELRAFIREGLLKSKIGEHGAMRGILYVPRQQCVQLREKMGYTEFEAAQRLGITVERLRHVLAGVDWRQEGNIPLVTLQAVKRRLQSRPGYTLEEAAKALGKTEQWVKEQVEAGATRVSRAPWDPRMVHLSFPMFERLRAAAAAPVVREKLGPEWLSLGDAALEAGVCSATVNSWRLAKELRCRKVGCHCRYHREAVRARARKYWQCVRLHRATPPAWLQAELDSKEAATKVSI